MPERPKGVDSKSTVSLWHRGFESLSLRHFNKKFGKLPFYTLPNLFTRILVDTNGISLKENLRSAWLQFYSEFLVIVAWRTEYPYLKDDLRRRALADAEKKRYALA